MQLVFAMATICVLSSCGAGSGETASESDDIFSLSPLEASRVLAEHELHFRAGNESEAEYRERLGRMIDQGLEAVRESPTPDRFQILSSVCGRSIDMGSGDLSDCTDAYREALSARDLEVMLRTPALLMRLRGREALGWMFNFVVYENGPLAAEILGELGARRRRGEFTEDEMQYITSKAPRLCADSRVTDDLRNQCKKLLLSNE